MTYLNCSAGFGIELSLNAWIAPAIVDLNYGPVSVEIDVINKKQYVTKWMLNC